jgi:hypothetical protein
MSHEAKNWKLQSCHENTSYAIDIPSPISITMINWTSFIWNSLHIIPFRNGWPVNLLTVHVNSHVYWEHPTVNSIHTSSVKMVLGFLVWLNSRFVTSNCSTVYSSCIDEHIGKEQLTTELPNITCQILHTFPHKKNLQTKRITINKRYRLLKMYCLHDLFNITFH